MDSVSPLDGDGSPWYRHFWPWFIVALLGVAVTASLATVYIAFANRDALVRDDYYEDGTKINRRLELIASAERLGIVATLDFAPSAGSPAAQPNVVPGEIALALSGEDIDDIGWIRLDLSHPTRAERDQQVMLARMPDGQFRGRAQSSLDGRWYATLEPVVKGATASGAAPPPPAWRVTGTLHLPARDPVTLGRASAER